MCFQLLLNHELVEGAADLGAGLGVRAAVGAGQLPWADPAFYMSVSFVVITGLAGACGPPDRPEPRKRGLVVSPACGRAGAGGILQKTSRTQASRGGRGCWGR